MGTAGLNVTRLARLLERIKVESVLIEGDHAQDHCTLRLESVRGPHFVATLEYVNQGDEPRVAILRVERYDGSDETNSFLVLEESLRLRGARRDDPKKIAAMVEQWFSLR
jgi:hypothetical protein